MYHQLSGLIEQFRLSPRFDNAELMVSFYREPLLVKNQNKRTGFRRIVVLVVQNFSFSLTEKNNDKNKRQTVGRCEKA